VATQDPELRKLFSGKPEFVETFFRFVAEDVRELMGQLGFRTIDEMIGRVDKIDIRPALDHWKAAGLDLSQILYKPVVAPTVAQRCVRAQDHGLDKALDNELVRRCAGALERRTPVEFSIPIRNVNRTVGTMLGYEVTTRYGAPGLPDGTIKIHFTGSAGQSFGAFLPRGITLTLEGDANDYWGKGLSGGVLAVFPSPRATFVPEDNIIVGNVTLYGATSGEAYVRGVAGERFAVRNSGARAVVEGVGDHGCEYMTGGRVVVLGKTGRNFAAGMSGGIAYVLDAHGRFSQCCNTGMVDLDPLADDDWQTVREMIERHIQYTNSSYAARILSGLESRPFVKVMPRDFKRVLRAEAKARAESREPEFSELVGAIGG
jgi:glutamate synthase (ferredoxin)